MMYSLSGPSLLNSRFNRKAWLGTMQALSSVGRNLDPAIFSHFQPHAHATARLARRFAAYLFGGGRHRYWLDEVEVGAYVHDVGKYFIEPEILLKPAGLDEEERKIVSLHSVYGALAVSKLPWVTEVIHSITLHHHEHWAGTGYPDGVAGVRIPLEARMVAVVDVYISLRARRSYKQTFSRAAALEGLGPMAGRELDPALVEDFIRWNTNQLHRE